LIETNEIAVIGFGAMNLDYICRVAETVADGEAMVTDFIPAPGGSAANTIYGLAKLGISTGFIGAVGNDAEGRKLIRDLKAVGTDISHIHIKKAAKTGLAFCFSDKKGRRAIYLLPGANSLLDSQDIDTDYLNSPQIAHFSSFAEDRQLYLQLEAASNLTGRTKLSFAPGMLYASKGLRVLLPLLERSRIVFLNREEIELLTGKDFKTGAEKLVQLGSDIVVVTLGRGIPLGNGKKLISYICTRQAEHQVTSADETLENIETTGAGDAFASGFLFGMLRNKNLNECGLLGDIVARFVISAPGGRRGFPTPEQLSRAFFKRAGYPLAD